MIKAYMKALSRLLAFGCISFYLLAPSAIVFAAVPPTCQLHLNTTTISVGGSVTLSWTSTNATSGAITNVGNVGPSGSINLLPSSAQFTTYIGSFTGPGGTANCSATVQVTAGGGGGTTATTDTGGGTSNSIGNAGASSAVSADNSKGVLSSSGSGLVPCGIGGFTGGSTGSTSCNACYLVQLVQRIITFVIGLSFPIAAALFAWAGVLYFISAGDHHKIDQAKSIFKNALIGFLIAVTAWLVVNTLLSMLFANSTTILKGSWFGGFSCTATRPVTGDISTVLQTVLGNAQVTNNISTGGTPTPGSAAYTAAQQQTAIDSAYYALYNSCFNDNNQASCAAYKALPDPSKNPTLDQVLQVSKDQLAALCDNKDTTSCNAYLAIYNPTTITPDSSLFTSGTSGATVSNPQMAAQLAAACTQDNLSSSNCAIAQQIARNESTGGNNCTTSSTGAAGCMQVLATTACGVDPSISSACSACLNNGNGKSTSAACAPVIQTIVDNPQLGTNLGVQYIANLQNMPVLQSYEAQSGACPITAAAYYAGPGNVTKAGGVIANIVIPNAAPNAPTAAQYVAKACGS